jgi:hypothetical protein
MTRSFKMNWPNSLKKWLVCGVLCVSPTFANANVVFYVNAHPDDAELFMALNLSHDIYEDPDANTIVLITTTAGDAGAGNGNSTGILPYYLARELGHANALQFLEGLTGTLQGSLFVGTDTLLLPTPINYGAIGLSTPPPNEPVYYYGSNGKKIYVYQAEMLAYNLYWINLRLPDGNFNSGDPCRGYGYASTGWQSLTYLNNQGYVNIGSSPSSSICIDPNTGKQAAFSSTIGAVDSYLQPGGGNGNSSTYTEVNLTKNDIIAVFQNIIKTFVRSAGNGQIVWANLVEQSPFNAVADHPDHQATSSLFTQALAGPAFACVNQAFFTTYINGYVSEVNPNVINPYNFTTLSSGVPGTQYGMNFGTSGTYIVSPNVVVGSSVIMNPPVAMGSEDVNILVGLWGTVNAGRNAGGQQNTWEPDHNSWVATQRVRTIPTNATCSF